MRTLPFGAAASVHHFLRVSSFVHAGEPHTGLCWGAYFDDFPIMCNVASKRSTMSTALGIFELLGLKYNDEKLDLRRWFYADGYTLKAELMQPRTCRRGLIAQQMINQGPCHWQNAWQASSVKKAT